MVRAPKTPAEPPLRKLISYGFIITINVYSELPLVVAAVSPNVIISLFAGYLEPCVRKII